MSASNGDPRGRPARPLYSLAEKITLAARDLEDAGRTPFSLETLVVAAWQADPKALGLRGFEAQHPDSNRVIVALAGPKGLVGRGWLRREGEKIYRLTAEGRGVCCRLLGEPPPPPAVVGLGAAQKAMLARLVDHPVAVKMDHGGKAELKFADACDFWGLSPRTRPADVAPFLERFRANLRALAARVEEGEARLPSGRAVAPADLRFLANLHEWLLERFERQLHLLATPRRTEAAAGH